MVIHSQSDAKFVRYTYVAALFIRIVQEVDLTMIELRRYFIKHQSKTHSFSNTNNGGRLLLVVHLYSFRNHLVGEIGSLHLFLSFSFCCQ